MMRRFVSLGLAIAGGSIIVVGMPVLAQAIPVRSAVGRELQRVDRSGAIETAETAEIGRSANQEVNQEINQEVSQEAGLEDVPEEILRLEIITEARSPIDGRPLTAVEYAQLQAELRNQPDLRSDVSPELRNLIRLLYLRRAIRSIFPFLLN